MRKGICFTVYYIKNEPKSRIVLPGIANGEDLKHSSFYEKQLLPRYERLSICIHRDIYFSGYSLLQASPATQEECRAIQNHFHLTTLFANNVRSGSFLITNPYYLNR